MADVRLIDANALEALFLRFHMETDLLDADWYTPYLFVKDAPTIDAVPVVRCRECKYRGDELKCPMCFDEWDEEDPGFLRIDKTVDDGFCHMGAKMDGGAE